MAVTVLFRMGRLFPTTQSLSLIGFAIQSSGLRGQVWDLLCPYIPASYLRSHNQSQSNLHPPSWLKAPDLAPGIPKSLFLINTNKGEQTDSSSPVRCLACSLIGSPLHLASWKLLRLMAGSLGQLPAFSTTQLELLTPTRRENGS